MDVYYNYCVSDFIDLIERELEERRFVAALFLALTVPDVCSGGKGKYKDWYDRWVAGRNGSGIINGNDCYEKLRCKILHKGKTGEGYSLSFDSKNDIRLGHVVLICTDNKTGEEEKSVKVNINDLVEDIIDGARAFIKENDDFGLFRLTDYGKYVDEGIALEEK